MRITNVNEQLTTVHRVYFLTEPPLNQKYLAEFLRLKSGGPLTNYEFKEIRGMLLVTCTDPKKPVLFSDEAKKTIISLLEGAGISLADAAKQEEAKKLADIEANKKHAEQIASQFGVLLSTETK